MLFDEYDPINDKLFQVMDNNGKITAPQWKPDISDEMVLESYKFMLFARTADLMSVSYQRQGRMYTYPPNLGQEAIAVGAGKLFRPQDWLVPAFREMGAWLLKGARLRDLFSLWGGFEDGNLNSNAPNFLPICVPIASQLPHAAGIAYALKYQKKEGAVFAFVGDGGSSQGDFHEALNFAAVWKAPVIFIINNNQYAISVPLKKQTASRNLAVKAVAYGIPGIKVDGNDFFAVYRAALEARNHADNGNGPALLECVTYRKGAHTTSDDPSLYRSSEEEQLWEERDPIKRLRAWLAERSLWKEEDEPALIDEYKKEIDKEFSIYENHAPYPVEDVFRFHYHDMPPDLKQQQISYEKFLNWRKEAQK